MPHTTSAQRVAGLRGRLYEAQNKYQARLREADLLERQLLMIAAERAKTEALLLERQLAAAAASTDASRSWSRRDSESFGLLTAANCLSSSSASVFALSAAIITSWRSSKSASRSRAWYLF